MTLPLLPLPPRAFLSWVTRVLTAHSEQHYQTPSPLPFESSEDIRQSNQSTRPCWHRQTRGRTPSPPPAGLQPSLEASRTLLEGHGGGLALSQHAWWGRDRGPCRGSWPARLWRVWATLRLYRPALWPEGLWRGTLLRCLAISWLTPVCLKRAPRAHL